MAITLREKHYISVGSTRLVAIGFTDWLDAGVLLTGTPTIVEVGTTDLTITNKAINTGTIVVDDITCLAGQAVQFLVTGAVAGTTYTIKVIVGTTSMPAETEVFNITLIGV